MSELLIFILVFSLNDSGLLLGKIQNMRLMRVYEIKGRLGVWTENFMPSGNLVQKASYGKNKLNNNNNNN